MFFKLDLSDITDNYIQRSNYIPNCSITKFRNKITNTSWGIKVDEVYRIIARKMLNQSGERTLICSIIAPAATHINGIISFVFKNYEYMILSSGLWSSLPFDYMIKTIGKSNLNFDSVSSLPITTGIYNNRIKIRSLLLNSVSLLYSTLWKECYTNEFTEDKWSKLDHRLNNNCFSMLTNE